MTLDQNLKDLATRLGTESKALRTLINGNASDLSGLTTTTKTNLVAALNELKAAVANASGINDGTTSTASVWSSQKTSDSISAAIAAVVNGAPTAFDTLKELADGLASDQTQLSAVLTALDKRVSVAAAQSFTTGEQSQGRSNIGAVASADVGPTNTDYVALFNTALT